MIMEEKKMLSTKDAGQSKVLHPGNVLAKINSIVLVESVFKVPDGEPTAYDLVFNIEGPDMGPKFKGFSIDQNDPAKGNYKGAIGKVKAGMFPFKNFSNPTVSFDRDEEILKYIKNVCRELGLEDQEGYTIEEIVDNLNTAGQFKDKWVRMTIAGKEYTNKKGYTNFELFFPNYTMKATPFELDTVPVEKSRLLAFDKTVHLKAGYKPEVLKDGFGEEGSHQDSGLSLEL